MSNRLTEQMMIIPEKVRTQFNAVVATESGAKLLTPVSVWCGLTTGNIVVRVGWNEDGSIDVDVKVAPEPDPLEEFAGECRSCGAPIYWAITEKGKRMPVDVDPAENGNIRLQPMREEIEVTGSEDSKDMRYLLAVYDSNQENLLGEPEPRYLSHFATCEQAKKWRRK